MSRLYSTATAIWLLAGAAHAGQIASPTYFLLQRGMSESEVLLRAGPPDIASDAGDESHEHFSGRVVTTDDGAVGFDTFRTTSTARFKEWHYVPDRSEHDPHLTVITFRAGKVWEIERTKVFSKQNLPPPPEAASPPKPTLTGEALRRRQLDRTLEAAERYAETRARIKAREGDAGPGPEGPNTRRVFRRVSESGEIYFGDRPPAAPGIEYVDVE